jgi:hypothetical protein
VRRRRARVPRRLGVCCCRFATHRPKTDSGEEGVVRGLGGGASRYRGGDSDEPDG